MYDDVPSEMVYPKRRESDDPKRFKFDNTVTMGSLIQIVVLVISLVSVLYKIAGIENKVDLMWQSFTLVSKVK